MDNAFGLWLAGACLSGFFFLAVWIRNVDAYSNKRDTELQTEISDKVSLTSCASTSRTKDSEVAESIVTLTATVNEIKDAILGTLEKKGMITTQREHEQRIDRLEKKPRKKT